MVADNSMLLIVGSPQGILGQQLFDNIIKLIYYIILGSGPSYLKSETESESDLTCNLSNSL
jgi:hypothetical protein